MYYPKVEENVNTRATIDTFLGYNHGYKVGKGEFYNMENLSSDNYPVLTIRDPRTTLLSCSEEEVEDAEGNKSIEYTSEYNGCLYTGGELAYLEDAIFHYGLWYLNMGKLFAKVAQKVTQADNEGIYNVAIDHQEMLRFGDYILMFPAGLWVHLTKKEAGTIAAKLSLPSSTTVTYSLCDINGDEYDNVTVSTDEPSDPQTGDYWLCTQEGSKGLNIYYNSSWTPVATTYIKMDIPLNNTDLRDYFAEEDVVYLNSNLVKDINNGSVIQKIGSNYLVFIGLIEDVIEEHTTAAWTITIERKVPQLDYVCVSKNRVWGCRYGYETGDYDNIYNEIYCSKLGDFKNWYSYQGLSTDSYSVTVGSPGEWTGCISYQGYPTFFKENMMYRVFGSYPAEYSISEKELRGVQLGSSKSLAIMGEYLYYKAPGGIMVYDGSTPTLISQQFGRDLYYFDGVAGCAGTKYYIQVTNDKGNRFIFVYDSQHGIWTKETQFVEYRKDGTIPNVAVNTFTFTPDGKLFAMTPHCVYGIGQQDDAMYEFKLKGGEDFVKWWAETGDLGYEYADYKYVSKISIRAYLPYISELKIEISYDDRNYEQIGIVRNNANTQTINLTIQPVRCDHFRIKISGHGAVRIYNMTTTLDVEGEDYGFKN